MRVEIDYKLYCWWGAVQNTSLYRSAYPNGQMRYWFEVGGKNYKPTPEIKIV